jgi:hypothetical protein
MATNRESILSRICVSWRLFPDRLPQGRRPGAMLARLVAYRSHGSYGSYTTYVTFESRRPLVTRHSARPVDCDRDPN